MHHGGRRRLQRTGLDENGRSTHAEIITIIIYVIDLQPTPRRFSDFVCRSRG